MTDRLEKQIAFIMEMDKIKAFSGRLSSFMKNGARMTPSIPGPSL